MRLLALACVLVLFVACDQPPVAWREPSVMAQRAVSGASHLVIDAAGHARFVPDSAPLTGRPNDPRLCTSSLQTVPATVHLYAVWWSVRPDSSAALEYATSTDAGKTWAGAIAVDTTDASTRGCSRPAPSLTAVGDDMFVAYSIAAPDGTGVFFAHTMAGMLHSTVAVTYGDRLVPTAIAAEGSNVAVAFEDPSGTRQQIGLALSTTEGHIFEQHLSATPDVDAATSPAVAIHGPWIAVSWLEQRFDSTASGRMVRVGRVGQ